MSHFNKSLLRYPLLSVLILGLVIGLFQNCAQSFRSTKSKSPFASGKNKYRVPAEATQLDLVFLINEKMRSNGECEASTGFVFKYIKEEKLSLAEANAMKIPFKAHRLLMEVEALNDDFAAMINADPCVLGVSEAQSLSSDNSDSLTLDLGVFDGAEDLNLKWKKSIGFPEVSSALQSEVQKLLGKEIKIAVTGTDFNTHILFHGLTNYHLANLLPVGAEIQHFPALERSDILMADLSPTELDSSWLELKDHVSEADWSSLLIQRKNLSYEESRKLLIETIKKSLETQSSNDLKKLAGRNTLARAESVDSSVITNSIVKAVNSGSSIIYIPVAAPTAGCDPLLGEVIYQAIRSGSLIIFPAGDRALSLPTGQLDQSSFELTVSPACWGPVFQGAITVGGARTTLDSDNVSFAEFSNYGPAVEILAPATSIPLSELDNEEHIWSGTQVTVPSVITALTWIQASHLNNNWPSSPEIIEELLRRGSKQHAGSMAKVLHLPTLQETLKDYATLTPEQREKWNKSSLQENSKDVHKLNIETNSLFVEASKEMLITAQLVTNNEISLNSVQGEVLWTLSEPLMGTLTVDQGQAKFKANNLIGRVTLRGLYVTDRVTAEGEIELVVTPPPTKLGSASLMWRTEDTGWKKFSTSLQIDRKVQLAMSAVGSDGVTRDISDSANFFMREPAGSWQTMDKSLTPEQIINSSLEIKAVSQDLVATANVTSFSIASVTAPTVNPANSKIKTLTYRVTRGWLELDPIILKDSITNEEATAPFSDFEIFLQDSKGKLLFLSQKEDQGLYFIKLWGLATGIYNIIVRHKAVDIYNTGEVDYNKTALVKVDKTTLSPPEAWQAPFISKEPTGACAHPAERIRMPFASGNGTLLAPYVICTTAHFQEMLRILKTAPMTGDIKVFRLRDHLDLSTIPNYDNNPVSAFSLTGCSRAAFEGNGYSIKGLVQLTPERDYAGMFACFKGVVSNLTIIDPVVSGRDNVGAFAGIFYGNMVNVLIYGTKPTASVSGRNNVGGLIGGSLSSVVTRSGSYKLFVKATGNYVGGIVGWIDDCAKLVQTYVRQGSIRYMGSIGDGLGVSYGGLSGHHKAIVLASLFDGMVRANRNVCGIGGQQIIKSRSSGTLEAFESQAAGLVCDEYNSATNTFSSVKGGGYDSNTIDSKITAPSKVGGIFINGSYKRRTTLYSNTIKADLNGANLTIAGAVLEDEYAGVAEAFEIPSTVYESYFWNNNIFHTPPISATTAEVGVKKKHLSVSNVVPLNAYDHPEVKANGSSSTSMSLSFAPSSLSNSTMLNVALSGEETLSYDFKVGPVATTECQERTGYSQLKPTEENINADLSQLADGDMLLCVRPQGSATRTPASVPILATTWTQDTLPPASVVISSDENGRLLIQESEDIKTYLYKFGPAWSVDCSQRRDYHGPTQSKQSIETQLISLPYAAVKLCVIGLDESGNQQVNPTSKVWTAEAASQTPLLLGLPRGPSSNRKVEARLSGFNLQAYKIKFGPSSSLNCEALEGYSSDIRISASVTLDVEKFPDGEIAVCALGQNFNGEWMQTKVASRGSWLKDTVPPRTVEFLLPIQDPNTDRAYASIIGEDIKAYRYKIGSSNSTNCEDDTGYSTTEYEAQEPVLIDFLVNGRNFKLCAKVRDAAGNWMSKAGSIVSSY